MKKACLILSAVMMTAMMLSSCGGGSKEEGASKEVTIGTQVWMTKNLDVATFRNGDPIPEAKTDAEWEKAGENKQPAWCYYENDPANGAKYGKLYNWYAVNDPRGLAPTGYHIPSDAEWTTLVDFLGNDANDEQDLNGVIHAAEKKMKSTNGWNEEDNGTYSSGFNGLPGGYRYGNGTFGYVGKGGTWWSSTENGTNNAWFRGLGYYGGPVDWDTNNKPHGFSVRCLRD